MKNNFWSKRIPTLLGILMITFAIAGTTYLLGKPTFFTGTASPSSEPGEIRITNITDAAFSISYTTSDNVLGSINIGKDRNLGQILTDNKDQGKIKEHKVHSFTAGNLSPSTKYYFSITSGQGNFLNNGVPYEVTTGQESSLKKGAGFIVGKVVTSNGQIPKEGLVFATSQGAQTLSSDLKSDGTYTISLEGIRKDDLSTGLDLKGNSQIKLLVLTDSGTSNAIILGKNVNSVPIIIVGKNYDFSAENEVASQSATFGKFPPVSSGKVQGTPKITSPSDNQSITDTKPVFSGTALPNSKISVTINSSQTIQTQVTSDTNGNWSFQPSTTLSSGQHTITIAATDSSGILRTITQTFVIAPVAQAATPTPTPSPTITPTPTPTPRASSSASLSPTPTPTGLPTLIPTPTPTPVPVPTLLPTGNSDVSTGFLGIATFAVGLVFLLISKLIL